MLVPFKSSSTAATRPIVYLRPFTR